MSLHQRNRTNNPAGSAFWPLSITGSQLGEISLTFLDLQIQLTSQASILQTEQAIHHTIKLLLTRQEACFSFWQMVLVNIALEAERLQKLLFKVLDPQKVLAKKSLQSRLAIQFLLTQEGIQNLLALFLSNVDTLGQVGHQALSQKGLEQAQRSKQLNQFRGELNR